MKLTIQIVNYRSRHYLRECLFSIRENMPLGIEAEIIIINNDEQKLENFDLESAGAVPVRKIELQKNIGFGKAHNRAFRDSRGEYILFLNPDTKILPGALEKILCLFSENEKIGVASPLLVDLAGKIQPDIFGSRRTPFSIIAEKFFAQKKQGILRDKDIFEVDWVSGGAMLVRRSILEAVGGFDENFFMYFEDLDFCLRAKKAGCKVVAVPSARIFHESGKSFESEREKKKYYYASQDYYLRKHFGLIWSGALRLLRLPYYVKNVYFSPKNKKFS
jgi:GT2 family glycosyltransferase